MLPTALQAFRFTRSVPTLSLLLSSHIRSIMATTTGSHPHDTTTTASSTTSPPPLNAAYRMWDDRYSEEGFAYGSEPNQFLQQSFPSLQLKPHSKVLMLAEGEGRNGVFVAQQGMDVTCVDLSAVGLQKAQELAQQRGVTIHTEVVDLTHYDFGTNQWDCIVGIHCHLPPTVRERVLQAIPSSLKSGGTVLFETYTPEQLEYKTGGPPSAEWMYSADIFNAAFADQLQIERNEELVRDVLEGKYHSGQAAVVQFIGRKNT